MVYESITELRTNYKDKMGFTLSK